MTQVLYGFDLYELYANWGRPDRDVHKMCECATEMLLQFGCVSLGRPLTDTLLRSQTERSYYWAAECVLEPATGRLVLAGALFGQMAMGSRDTSPCFYAMQKRVVAATEELRCEINARLQSVALWRTAQRSIVSAYVPAGMRVDWHDTENGVVVTQADCDGTFVSV